MAEPRAHHAITARQRDQIVADIRALADKHGLSPIGLGKFVPFAAAEARQAERKERLVSA